MVDQWRSKFDGMKFADPRMLATISAIALAIILAVSFVLAKVMWRKQPVRRL